MHERSLVLNLLRRVTELTVERGPGRVTEIDVEVGDFAGIEVDLFASAFAQETTEAPWCRPTLQIRRVKLRAECVDCGPVELAGMRFVCPTCGSTELEIRGGDDVRLLSFTWATALEELS